MKLALLSRNARLYSTRRLVEAARARGHRVRVLDPLRCYLRIGEAGFELHYKGRRLAGFDAALPRFGASITPYACAVLRQFELMGVASPNPSDAVLRTRDKLRSLQLLSAAGLAMPATVFGDNPDDTEDLLSMLGPAPHVIKLNEGAQGAGVLLAETLLASRSMVEALRGLRASFLAQRFIAEAEGRDLRCFVVAGRVVAAMQREAAPGEFRANLHRGGSASAVTLSPTERRLAVRAAATLGLGIAGVDLLRSRQGPLLLEVNVSPGLEGIEQASGVDVAGKIIESIVKFIEKR